MVLWGLLGCLVAVILAGIGGFLWALNAANVTLTTVIEPARLPIASFMAAADPALGSRIVHVRNGCTDCHGSDLGGKMVINNPLMGFIYAPNLTPFHLATWSDQDIFNALRLGINKSHLPLVLMPSQDYQYLSGGDIAAIVAYLRTVSVVERQDTPTQVGPLAKMLFAMGKLPTFIPAASGAVRNTSTFSEKPAEGDSAGFGQYIVDTACRGCHGSNLQGGPIAGGPPDWPAAANISASALQSWQEADFKRAMREGVNKKGEKLRLPMPIALTSQYTDAELSALWKYLQSPR